MKISNTTPNYINPYTKPNSTAAAQKPAEGTFTDSINLSDRTKELQTISKAIDTEPADREKYVENIKLQVENNQYNVNAEQVAQKIVGAFMDNFG